MTTHLLRWATGLSLCLLPTFATAEPPAPGTVSVLAAETRIVCRDSQPILELALTPEDDFSEVANLLVASGRCMWTNTAGGIVIGESIFAGEFEGLNWWALQGFDRSGRSAWMLYGEAPLAVEPSGWNI